MREEILKNQCEYYIRQNRESKEWWEELKAASQYEAALHIGKYLFGKEDYEALKRYCSENLKFLDKKILFPMAEIFILTVWLITRQIWRNRQE